MRVSREEKERSRRRIVSAATRRMRGRGIAGTSVADVMADAELTHGGFYRHFTSKDELLVSALNEAYADLLAPLEAATAEMPHREALQEFVVRYLSADHVDAAANGCPIAALSTEIPRETAALKTAFASGISRTVRALAVGEVGVAGERRDAAITLLMQLVGAVVLARASDPPLARELLRVARAAVDVRTEER